MKKVIVLLAMLAVAAANVFDAPQKNKPERRNALMKSTLTEIRLYSSSSASVVQMLSLSRVKLRNGNALSFHSGYQFGDIVDGATAGAIRGGGTKGSGIRRRVGRMSKSSKVKEEDFRGLKVQIGDTVVTSPSRGLGYVLKGTNTLMELLGSKALRKIMKLEGAVFNRDFKVVTFVQVNATVITFPTLTAIYDHEGNNVFAIAHSAGRFSDQSVAFALKQTIYTIRRMVKTALKLLKLDCIPIKAQEVRPPNKAITFNLGDGRICGLTTLTPYRFVTVLRDDEQMLVVRTPYVIRMAKATFRHACLNGLSNGNIANETMLIRVKHVKVYIDITLKPAKNWEFAGIHMELAGLEQEFKVQFPFVKRKTYAMHAIENLFLTLRNGILGLVNKLLIPVEKKLEKLILGKHKKFGFLTIKVRN